MASATEPLLRVAEAKLPPFAFPALLAANVALATGAWFVRVADTGPIATGFWRLALVVPLLLPFALTGAGGPVRLSRGTLAMIVTGGLFFASDLASWHLGIMRTKLANATLFGNCSSLLLPFAGILLTRIWPTRLQWVALACAMVGAMLLMGSSYELSRQNLAGDLLCLLAGLLYVFYLLSVQSVRRSLSTFWVLGLSSLASAPLMLVYAWMAGERILPGNWGPVIGLMLTCQVVGQGLMVYAIAHFPPLVVGLVLLTQPAVAALIGWLAFGETLSAPDWAGALIIALALVLIRLPARDSPCDESLRDKAPQGAPDPLGRDA